MFVKTSKLNIFFECVVEDGGHSVGAKIEANGLKPNIGPGDFLHTMQKDRELKMNSSSSKEIRN